MPTAPARWRNPGSGRRRSAAFACPVPGGLPAAAGAPGARYSAVMSQRPPPAFHFLLKHETRALVRTVRPEDLPYFVRGYQDLSPESRHLRFFSQAAELTPKQLDFMTHPDHRSHEAWGALDLRGPVPRGIGVARYVGLPERPGVAEVALTIVDAYQNHGAGTLLHACLHLSAASQGYRTFWYDVLWENRAFLKYLKSLGATVVGNEANVVSLEMPVYGAPRDVPPADGTAMRFARLLHDVTTATPVDA